MQKPTLSFWQIWNMCFGFLGIQFGFALQNANVSRIFQTLGADYGNMALLWIAAPVTGLIVQPIIGHYSDRTWNRFGRRRPFFLLGAISASIALFIMPNSPYLWVAAGMLWIMDASINISMEPFRAFVGDMLPRKQRPMGYSMQSFFIGVGATVASLMPYIFAEFLQVSNTAPAGELPDTVKFSFYLGGAVFLLAVLWTVFKTEEYPPEVLAAYAQSDDLDSTRDYQRHLPVRLASEYLKDGGIWLAAGVVALVLIMVFQAYLDKQMFILGAGIAVFGVAQLVAGALARNDRGDNAFNSMMNDLFSMPQTMKKLAWVQFFSWFPLFAMWIYTTGAVTSHHYGTSDATSALYNEGANWVGVLFGAYNGFAALAAVVIPVIVRFSSLRQAHMLNLLLGALGFASFYWITDPTWLLLSMVGVGFAWASILSVPYALLANALPAQKMGIYLGIFNFFIVLPQILAASILGLMVTKLFANQPIFALLTGAVSMVIAALLVLRVDAE